MNRETTVTSDRSGGWLETRFALRARGSTVGREMLGALATFLTLSYILFVQPVVMSAALPRGVDPEYVPLFQASVLTAVCIASALACLLMGLLANIPVGLAPGMGHNFLFAFTVCGIMGFSWQQALAANVVAGAIFLLLSLLGMVWPKLDPRVILFKTMPKGLQNAIAVGIGLLIALVGLKFAGIVVPAPGTGLGLGIGQGTPWAAIAMAVAGLIVFGVLWARQTIGAPLWAIVASVVTGLALRILGAPGAEGLVSVPERWLATPTLGATAFHLDFVGLFDLDWSAVLIVIATFIFLDIFDTVGTLAAVLGRARLLERMEEGGRHLGGAFVADATGTVAGAVLGTSTITSYVESLAGVQAGARTGLAAIGVGVLFLLGLFIAPALAVVAAPYVIELPGGRMELYPALAAVLIGIGALMLFGVKEIAWDEPTEALPAFLTMIMMPLTLSITDGIAFGFISYVVLKALTGRWREVHPFVVVAAVLLATRYAM